jgi:hypothetical protein
MDDNLAAINSVADTSTRLIQDLTRQWTDFAQKTATAARLDPSVDSVLERVNANFDVVQTIRQTICLQELAQTALSEARERAVRAREYESRAQEHESRAQEHESRAREHERRMKSTADALERLVQVTKSSYQVT